MTNRFLVSYDETGRGMGDEQMVDEFPSQGQAMDFVQQQIAAGHGTDEQWIIDDLSGEGVEPENTGFGNSPPGAENQSYCGACGGTGFLGDDPCEACQGQGYIGEAYKFTPGKQSNDKKDREEASRSKTKPGKGKWSRADGKRIKTDEGYSMNLKEFFLAEAIWTGEKPRRGPSKQDADTWHDRRKDSKFDGSGAGHSDHKNKWDDYESKADYLKKEAIWTGEKPRRRGNPNEDPNAEYPSRSTPHSSQIQRANKFRDAAVNYAEEAFGSEVARKVNNATDEEILSVMAHADSSPENFVDFKYSDYQAGRGDYMKDEAKDPDDDGGNRYERQQDDKDQHDFKKSKWYKDDEQAGLADWEKAPKSSNKVSEAHGENAGHRRGEGEKIYNKPKIDKKDARNTKIQDFGSDPDKEMLFGSTDAQDYAGTITDPKSDEDMFKGGKVDDFGDDEPVADFGDVEDSGHGLDSDLSTLGSKGNREAPGSDVMFPEYEDERGRGNWGGNKKPQYSPSKNPAERHSDIEKAPSRFFGKE